MIGSHIDSVRNAGRYDGPLGVLVGTAAAERVREDQLPFALELVAFADEEGLRFKASYLASRAYAGILDEAELEIVSDDGETLAGAIQAMGGDPGRLAGSRRSPDGLLGYLEVHIEQEPVLQAEELPLGVVTAIAGQSRGFVEVAGEAGHAGNTPPQLRRDALCGAAEIVIAVEQRMQAEPGLIATVGKLEVLPNVGNVIPGLVTLSYDIRHQDDAVREEAVASLSGQAASICERRGLRYTVRPLQDHPAVAMSPRLRGLLLRAVESVGVRAARAAERRRTRRRVGRAADRRGNALRALQGRDQPPPGRVPCERTTCRSRSTRPSRFSCSLLMRSAVPEFDLVVRGGEVIRPSGIERVDIGILDGIVVAVEPELGGGAATIEAAGLHVLPGGVDPHVHFDEPGRTEWEGVASGTRALAAGGHTTYVDMPLNNIPVTVDGPSFDEKLPAVRASSLVDFALWGGLVEGNVDRLAEQHERGVAGFKAFMCHSGIDEFPAVGDLALYEGMQAIAGLDSILLLHAENAEPRRRPGCPGTRSRACLRTRLRRIAARARRGRGDQPGDPPRRGDGLPDAHRPHLDRTRRSAGRRGAGPRRRREL